VKGAGKLGGVRCLRQPLEEELYREKVAPERAGAYQDNVEVLNKRMWVCFPPY
jgi:hypothetical protein